MAADSQSRQSRSDAAQRAARRSGLWDRCFPYRNGRAIDDRKDFTLLIPNQSHRKRDSGARPLERSSSRRCGRCWWWSLLGWLLLAAGALARGRFNRPARRTGGATDRGKKEKTHPHGRILCVSAMGVSKRRQRDAHTIAIHLQQQGTTGRHRSARRRTHGHCSATQSGAAQQGEEAAMGMSLTTPPPQRSSRGGGGTGGGGSSKRAKLADGAAAAAALSPTPSGGGAARRGGRGAAAAAAADDVGAAVLMPAPAAPAATPGMWFMLHVYRARAHAARVCVERRKQSHSNKHAPHTRT